MSQDPTVAVVMGSINDNEVMQDASSLLNEFGIPFTAKVVSAHRTPARLYEFAQNAHRDGIKVIIAAAGGAAHLPGMIASMTIVPVIGVPIKSSALSGQDSLLSIVQMPPGVPVATMAINGAKNAAIMAAQILALTDSNVRIELLNYKAEMYSNVMANCEIHP